MRRWTDTEDLILTSTKSDRKAAFILDRSVEAVRKRRMRLRKGVQPLKGKHLCWNCLQLIDEKKDAGNFNSAPRSGHRIYWHKVCPEGADPNLHFKRRQLIEKTLGGV